MGLPLVAGSTWRGRAELWLDPLGDTAEWSDCTIRVDADRVTYTWARGETPHHGEVRRTDGGASFTDTFHAPTPLACDDAAPTGALLHVQTTYAAGDGPSWGWRIVLAHRPAVFGLSEALVLQMINVAPWGEETRAVRMTATRA